MLQSLLLLIVFILSSSVHAEQNKPVSDRFERISPKAAGYDQTKLGQLTEHLQQSGSSSLLLLHDGKVFYEWGDIHKKHLIHSIRKSLLSGLMGILYDQNKLPLDKSLAELNVDDYPTPLTQSEKQATVAMVLTSRSGIYTPATAETAGMLARKPERGSHQPGTYHYYNNWDFNFAGALFEQLSGESIFDAFYHHFAKPLGMLHFKNIQTRIDLPYEGELPDADAIYQYDLAKSRYPAYHFRMSAHDLALYGQLYLNYGRWNDKQILSQEWLDLSTRSYSITNERYGIGYGMLWRTLEKSDPNQSRFSFYHTGVGVHMLGIYPKHKLVMVHRVNTEADNVQFSSDDLYPVIRLMHAARITSQ